MREDYKMRFLYRIPILITLFLSMQTVWACMPLSKNDVFIARLQSSQPILMDNQQKGFDLQFSHHRFVFRTLKMWLMYSEAEHWQSDFELKGIVIALKNSHTAKENRRITYRYNLFPNLDAFS